MNSPQAGGSPSRRTWILAAAAGAVVFLVFEGVSDFVAVPLRECSSILAQAMLAATGFPVTRNGTILSTPQATFDVVPACSGSTTLQVLLFLSILWCGVHPRLTPGRKVLAILLAVPLAVAANGLRVAILVALGHVRGAVPEGLAHDLIGLLTFALAMAGCYGLTRVLASTAPGKRASDATLAWALAVLMAFLSLPFLAWCVGHWSDGTLDRLGFVFVLAAGAMASWRWLKTPGDRSRDREGTILLGLALLGLGIATFVDINILKGMFLLASFLGFSLAARGARFAASMIPLCLLCYLGFPSVSYQIVAALGGTLSSWPALLAIKAVAGLGFAIAAIALGRTSPGIVAGPPVSRLLPIHVLLAALVGAFQAYYLVTVASSTLQESRLEMSYLQGDWVGTDMEPPVQEVEYFGRRRIWARSFKRNRDVVDVLVTSTGGDRHRAHPPEYCVTGSGWTAVQAVQEDRRLGDGTRVPMTALRLRKDDRDMEFRYWFTDGTRARAQFSGMLLVDTLGRLGGRRSDWFVIRVMSVSGEEALEDFLSTFNPGLSTASGPHP